MNFDRNINEAILLDTNSLSDYLDKDNKFHQKIENFRFDKKLPIALTYCTWYECFKSLNTKQQIIHKIKLLSDFSSSVIFDNANFEDYKSKMFPNYWLENQFDLDEFNDFFANIKNRVHIQCSSLMFDTFLTLIYTLVICNYAKQDDKEITKKVNLFLAVINDNEQRIRKNIQMELFKLIDGKIDYYQFMIGLFNEIILDCKSSFDDIDINVLVKYKINNNILIKLRQFKNKKIFDLKIDLSSIETCATGIFEWFNQTNTLTALDLNLRKFLFLQSYLFNIRFDVNDYIDMINLFYSFNTNNFKIYYHTSESKWRLFIKQLNDVRINFINIDES